MNTPQLIHPTDDRLIYLINALIKSIDAINIKLDKLSRELESGDR